MQSLYDFVDEKAAEHNDPLWAIAVALFDIADEMKQTRGVLADLAFGRRSESGPGTTEKIAMELGRLANVAEAMALNED